MNLRFLSSLGLALLVMILVAMLHRITGALAGVIYKEDARVVVAELTLIATFMYDYFKQRDGEKK